MIKRIFIFLLIAKAHLGFSQENNFQQYAKRLYRLQAFTSRTASPIKGNAVLIGVSQDKKYAYFITCYHIVYGTNIFHLEPSYRSKRGLPLKSVYDKKDVEVQSYPHLDLAFIKVKNKKWQLDVEDIEFINRESIKQQFPYFEAIAFGYDQHQAGNFIVLDAYINDEKKYYQLQNILKNVGDKSQNIFFYKIVSNLFTSGMSGSPVFSRDGKLIGIVSFKYDERTYLISAENIKQYWQTINHKNYFAYNQQLSSQTIFYKVMLEYLRNDSPKYLIQFSIKRNNDTLVSGTHNIDIRDTEEIVINYPIYENELSDLEILIEVNERLSVETGDSIGRKIDETLVRGNGIAKIIINDVRLNIKIEFSNNYRIWPCQKVVSKQKARTRLQHLRNKIISEKVTECEKKEYISLEKSSLMQSGETLSYNEYVKIPDALFVFSSERIITK